MWNEVVWFLRILRVLRLNNTIIIIKRNENSTIFIIFIVFASGPFLTLVFATTEHVKPRPQGFFSHGTPPVEKLLAYTLSGANRLQGVNGATGKQSLQCTHRNRAGTSIKKPKRVAETS